MDREISIFGAKTTPRKLFDAFWQNLVYGFLAGSLPTVVALGNEVGILICAILFYTFLSIVLNRPSYKTRLGRFIIFPTSAAIGFYLGYKLMNLIF
ncbi:MAG: hypothetical protein KDH96_01405 [Candidatus Riesia sp.]|nr:hypothetical protein [Candidatus Riesia sp.]